jgi:hypothetical protein
MLTYDDSEHRYFWHGVEVPSLSVMLVDLGWGRDWAGIPEPVLELARTRGLQTHAAIDKYLAKDATFVDELSEASAPFFDSFLSVLEELPLTDSGISELPVPAFHENEVVYACTPDRVEPEAILEWKCTSRIHPSVWAQLAGQAFALDTPDKPRAVVHLLKTGKKAKVQWDPNPDLMMTMWINDLNKRAWKLAMKW